MSLENILATKAAARNELDNIFRNKEFCRVIHYSCGSIYDSPERGGPRIVAIVIKNLHSEEVKTFTIHHLAEIKNIKHEDIINNYDLLEVEVLDEFYRYLKENKDMKWINWNMQSPTYGFEAIAHRYKTLDGNEEIIIPSNRINLAHLLIKLYSRTYIEDEKLTNLIKYNKISEKDYLMGKDEAIAFKENDFSKCYMSTYRKVDIFICFLDMLADGTLKTKYTKTALYKQYPSYLIEKFCTHWVVLFLVVISAFYTLHGLVEPYINNFLE